MKSKLAVMRRGLPLSMRGSPYGLIWPQHGPRSIPYGRPYVIARPLSIPKYKSIPAISMAVVKNPRRFT